MGRLESLLKQANQELEDKSQENFDLEKALLEHQTMLQQSATRVSDLEDNQTELQKQVSSSFH